MCRLDRINCDDHYTARTRGRRPLPLEPASGTDRPLQLSETVIKEVQDADAVSRLRSRRQPYGLAGI